MITTAAPRQDSRRFRSPAVRRGSLRAFREREQAGVLIHGMGSLGKSSLAARIANRLPHYETVVLYHRYHALAVFEALLRALPPRLAPGRSNVAGVTPYRATTGR